MNTPKLIDNVFFYPVRVYYEDTDAGEIVYYANYFKFAERARTEFLRHFNIHQSQLLANERIAFAVRHAEADYKKPAKLDDLLVVETKIVHVAGASVKMEQLIKRADEVLVQVKVRIACIHLEGRPMALPKMIKQQFEQLLGK